MVPTTRYERHGCEASEADCAVVADMEGPDGDRHSVYVNTNCTLECGCCGEPNTTVSAEYKSCGYNAMVPDRSIETDRAWLRSVVAQAVRATGGKVP